ncbi:MAG: cold shock domain-containing protein [Acholeplasmatales bacterium]|jgi:CspA family cold shock protein|nr:cold shock domain-containing protein [Acholeplasmatales bacterium]
MTGTVKWFDSKKGYGFISDANGKELFVHYSNISASGYKALGEGDKVEFDEQVGKNGKPFAANVVKL